MKVLTTSLAAAVLSALGIYFLYDRMGWLGLLQNKVFVDITMFVVLMALLSIASALLSALLLKAVDREDRGAIRLLEERLRTLEERQ